MSGSGPDILRLLAQAREGDGAALGQLLNVYRNYLRFLARTGKHLLDGKAEPSDLVQEVLLKAGRDFDQFRGSTPGEWTVWLRQILVRSMADYGRRLHAQRRATSRELSLDQLLNQSSQWLDKLMDGRAPTADQKAEAGERKVILADALAELSPDYHDVIVLHDLQELDWDEIAQRMGRSKGSVRMLWARALKELRPLLAARLGELSDDEH